MGARRKIVIGAAVTAATLVIAGGAVAISNDVPALVWQQIGPPDSSLLPTERGIAASTVERSTIGEDDVAVAIPPEQNGALVLWVHGQGGNVEEILSEEHHVGMRDQLLDAGYTIASTDGTGNGWGNEFSVLAYEALADWATNEAGTTSNVLIGQSMGGLASLQLIDTLPDVAAWAGIYPVCNLDSVAATFPAALDAYGVAEWVSIPELSPVIPAGVDGLPMLFFHSPNDHAVPMDTNTTECSRIYEQNGAAVEVVQVIGDHGNQSAFQPERMVAFLDESLGH
jgi:pimeloyl-ACP methyl ester carboxylesterase